MIKRWLSNLVFLVATIVVCCLVLELGFRAVAGVPVFTLTDWRAARVVQSDAVGVTEYDELVGWHTKGGVKSNWLNTTDFGIRKNSADAPEGIRQGGILVIGDSFAAGSQVNDDESWPAQLETMIHQPVQNAAVGGWGVEQMNLRVQEMFDAIKPKVIILGGQDQAVLRLGYTSYGRPKPYYTMEGANLVLHNEPVPHVVPDPKNRRTSRYRAALSYSYILDQVIGQVAPAWWYTDENNRFYQAPISVDAVGCALTKEIKKQADTMGYRVLYLLQYGGEQVLTGQPSDFGQKFKTCALATGIQVVDDFDMMHAIAEKGTDALQQEYIMVGTAYGHMSRQGNHRVAELLAQALQQDVPPANTH